MFKPIRGLLNLIRAMQCRGSGNSIIPTRLVSGRCVRLWSSCFSQLTWNSISPAGSGSLTVSTLRHRWSTWLHFSSPFSSFTVYDTGPHTWITTPGIHIQFGSWLKLHTWTKSPHWNSWLLAWWSWSDFCCSWRLFTLAWMSGCKRSSCEQKGLPNIISASETPVTVCGVNRYLKRNRASFISREPLTNFFSPSFMVWTAHSKSPLEDRWYEDEVTCWMPFCLTNWRTRCWWKLNCYPWPTSPETPTFSNFLDRGLWGCWRDNVSNHPLGMRSTKSRNICHINRPA